jgi:ATP-binding cassette, subfamily C (CFTR/MRP), member 1
MSQHKAYRVITMLRGALVNMIYNKTMILPSTIIGDSSPVTLMSADIERIGAGMRYIYDVWASLIEIPIALWLLWGELGVASLGPIIVAVGTLKKSECLLFWR